MWDSGRGMGFGALGLQRFKGLGFRFTGLGVWGLGALGF